MFDRILTTEEKEAFDTYIKILMDLGCSSRQAFFLFCAHCITYYEETYTLKEVKKSAK